MALKVLFAVSFAVASIALAAPAVARTHHHHHHRHAAAAVHTTAHQRGLHARHYHVGRAPRHGAASRHLHSRPSTHAHVTANESTPRHAQLCQQVMIHGHWTQHCR